MKESLLLTALLLTFVLGHVLLDTHHLGVHHHGAGHHVAALDEHVVVVVAAPLLAVLNSFVLSLKLLKISPLDRYRSLDRPLGNSR